MCNNHEFAATNTRVKQTRSERQAQFDKVLAQYRGRLGRVALMYAGQESDDLLQEIFLQIWRSLPGYQNRSSIGTWCYRIAINTAITWRRKVERRRVEYASNNLDQHPTSNSNTPNHQAGLLQRFLSTLSDVDQAVLLMHLDNVDHTGIADALGVTPGAIRTRMSRIKQKLAAWDRSTDLQLKPKSPTREVANG